MVCLQLPAVLGQSFVFSLELVSILLQMTDLSGKLRFIRLSASKARPWKASLIKVAIFVAINPKMLRVTSIFRAVPSKLMKVTHCVGGAGKADCACILNILRISRNVTGDFAAS